MTVTIPTTRPERWQWLREQIAEWYTPLQADDGWDEALLNQAETRLGTKLPAALREWYQLAGRRTEVWSRQDFIVPPDEWKICFDESRIAEFLIFYREAQDVVQWGILREDCDKEDPPVYLLDWEQANTTKPGPEAGSISEFALAMFCHQLCGGGPGPFYWGIAHPDHQAASAIRQLPTLFSPWHWPTDNARMYAYGNNFVFCASMFNGTQINMSAKQRDILTKLAEITGFDWEEIYLPEDEEEG